MTTSWKIERFPYDMGDYLWEKSFLVLRALSNLWEIVEKESSNLPDGFKERIADEVYYALNNQTKVVALAHDSEWAVGDTAMIMDGGREGLYDLLVKYGLTGEAENLYPRQRQFRFRAPVLLDSLQKIKQLLYLERGEARPQICAELLRFDFNHPLVSTIRDLTESVSQGQLDWSEYTAGVLPIVRTLRAVVEEQLSKCTQTRTPNRVVVEG